MELGLQGQLVLRAIRETNLHKTRFPLHRILQYYYDDAARCLLSQVKTNEQRPIIRQDSATQGSVTDLCFLLLPYVLRYVFFTRKRSLESA